MAKQRSYNGRRADATRKDDMQTRALSLRAETLNEDARTVDATLSTETPVQVMDYRRWEPIDEVLLTDSGEFRSQVVMLEAHRRDDLTTMIGSVRGIKKSKDGLVGTLHFASDDERADRAWKLAQQGHLTDVSVGYRVLAYQDIDPGQTVTVAGRTFKAGQTRMRIVTRWKLREVSAVPVGADELATLRSHNGPDPASANQGETTMNKHLRKYLESLGLRADATEADAQAYFESLEGGQRSRAELIEAGTLIPSDDPQDGQRGAAPIPTPALAPTTELRSDPGIADLVRKATTDALTERDRLDTERVAAIRAEATEFEIPAEVAQRAIDARLTVDGARKEFLKHIRESRTAGVAAGFGIGSHDRDAASMTRALAAGMLIQMGHKPVDESLPEKSPERVAQERAADFGHRLRNLGLRDYCREALAMFGIHARSSYEVVEELHRDFNGQRNATAAISNIFTTSVNATLLKAYMESPDTTQGWVKEVDVADYKTNDVIQLSGITGLKRLGENGEAKEATFDDRIESFRVARYAEKFSVDEIAIVNDSMNVLQDVPNQMGIAAARLRPELVYAILNYGTTLTLADSVALYEANTHLNYLAGSGGALDADALQVGMTAVAKQYETLPNGEKRALNIVPKYFVGAADLAWTISILLNSVTRDHDGTEGNFNPLKGLLTPITDNRLGVLGVVDPATGTARAGLATAWYLFADPNEAEVIRVGYLRGTNRRPSVRGFVHDKGRFGLGWDIQHTLGAKATGYRGTYKADGA